MKKRVAADGAGVDGRACCDEVSARDEVKVGPRREDEGGVGLHGCGKDVCVWGGRGVSREDVGGWVKRERERERETWVSGASPKTMQARGANIPCVGPYLNPRQYRHVGLFNNSSNFS